MTKDVVSSILNLEVWIMKLKHFPHLISISLLIPLQREDLLKPHLTYLRVILFLCHKNKNNKKLKKELFYRALQIKDGSRLSNNNKTFSKKLQS
jgi:hypothetical protein